jgi:hypothetical protein
VAAAAVIALLAAGCFNPFDPRIASVRGATQKPPVPNSARGVVELFRWCWNNRAFNEYTEIFTEDFVFQYTNRDTAGNQRSEILNRDEELDIARNLFIEGTASEPPAKRINLQYTNTLIAFPDSRSGKAFPWHQEVSTLLTLEIDTDEQQFRITGRAVFFLVRGDSARIPEELRDRFGPDTTRWWIEGWTDETDDSPAALAPADPPPAGPGAAPAAAGAGRAAAGETAALPGAGHVSPPSGRPAGAERVAAPFALSWHRLKRAYLGR